MADKNASLTATPRNSERKDEERSNSHLGSVPRGRSLNSTMNALEMTESLFDATAASLALNESSPTQSPRGATSGGIREGQLPESQEYKADTVHYLTAEYHIKKMQRENGPKWTKAFHKCIVESRKSERPRAFVICDDPFRFMMYCVLMQNSGCDVTGSRNVRKGVREVAPSNRDPDTPCYDVVIFEKNYPCVPDITVVDLVNFIRSSDIQFQSETGFVARHTVICTARTIEEGESLLVRGVDFFVLRPLFASMDVIRRIVCPAMLRSHRRIALHRRMAYYSRIKSQLDVGSDPLPPEDEEAARLRKEYSYDELVDRCVYLTNKRDALMKALTAQKTETNKVRAMHAALKSMTVPKKDHEALQEELEASKKELTYVQSALKNSQASVHTLQTKQNALIAAQANQSRKKQALRGALSSDEGDDDPLLDADDEDLENVIRVEMQKMQDANEALQAKLDKSTAELDKLRRKPRMRHEYVQCENPNVLDDQDPIHHDMGAFKGTADALERAKTQDRVVEVRGADPKQMMPTWEHEARCEAYETKLADLRQIIDQAEVLRHGAETKFVEMEKEYQRINSEAAVAAADFKLMQMEMKETKAKLTEVEHRRDRSQAVDEELVRMQNTELTKENGNLQQEVMSLTRRLTEAQDQLLKAADGEPRRTSFRKKRSGRRSSVASQPNTPVPSAPGTPRHNSGHNSGSNSFSRGSRGGDGSTHDNATEKPLNKSGRRKSTVQRKKDGGAAAAGSDADGGSSGPQKDKKSDAEDNQSMEAGTKKGGKKTSVEDKQPPGKKEKNAGGKMEGSIKRSASKVTVKTEAVTSESSPPTSPKRKKQQKPSSPSDVGSPISPNATLTDLVDVDVDVEAATLVEVGEDDNERATQTVELSELKNYYAAKFQIGVLSARLDELKKVYKHAAEERAPLQKENTELRSQVATLELKSMKLESANEVLEGETEKWRNNMLEMGELVKSKNKEQAVVQMQLDKHKKMVHELSKQVDHARADGVKEQMAAMDKELKYYAKKNADTQKEIEERQRAVDEQESSVLQKERSVKDAVLDLRKQKEEANAAAQSPTADSKDTKKETEERVLVVRQVINFTENMGDPEKINELNKYIAEMEEAQQERVTELKREIAKLKSQLGMKRFGPNGQEGDDAGEKADGDGKDDTNEDGLMSKEELEEWLEGRRRAQREAYEKERIEYMSQLKLHDETGRALSEEEAAMEVLPESDDEDAKKTGGSANDGRSVADSDVTSTRSFESVVPRKMRRAFKNAQDALQKELELNLEDQNISLFEIYRKEICATLEAVTEVCGVSGHIPNRKDDKTERWMIDLITKSAEAAVKRIIDAVDCLQYVKLLLTGSNDPDDDPFFNITKFRSLLQSCANLGVFSSAPGMLVSSRNYVTFGRTSTRGSAGTSYKSGEGDGFSPNQTLGSLGDGGGVNQGIQCRLDVLGREIHDSLAGTWTTDGRTTVSDGCATPIVGGFPALGAEVECQTDMSLLDDLLKELAKNIKPRIIKKIVKVVPKKESSDAPEGGHHAEHAEGGSTNELQQEQQQQGSTDGHQQQQGTEQQQQQHGSTRNTSAAGSVLGTPVVQAAPSLSVTGATDERAVVPVSGASQGTASHEEEEKLKEGAVQQSIGQPADHVEVHAEEEHCFTDACVGTDAADVLHIATMTDTVQQGEQQQQQATDQQQVDASGEPMGVGIRSSKSGGAPVQESAMKQRERERREKREKEKKLEEVRKEEELRAKERARLSKGIQADPPKTHTKTAGLQTEAMPLHGLLINKKGVDNSYYVPKLASSSVELHKTLGPMLRKLREQAFSALSLPKDHPVADIGKLCDSLNDDRTICEQLSLLLDGGELQSLMEESAATRAVRPSIFSQSLPVGMDPGRGAATAMDGVPRRPAALASLRVNPHGAAEADPQQSPSRRLQRRPSLADLPTVETVKSMSLSTSGPVLKQLKQHPRITDHVNPFDVRIPSPMASPRRQLSPSVIRDRLGPAARRSPSAPMRSPSGRVHRHPSPTLPRASFFLANYTPLVQQHGPAAASSSTTLPFQVAMYGAKRRWQSSGPTANSAGAEQPVKQPITTASRPAPLSHSRTDVQRPPHYLQPP